MTSSMRKKVLVGGGGIVGLLIVALLAAPAAHRRQFLQAQIAAEVKKATGRDLVLDGPITLSLLPMPAISISGVKFFNVPGSKNANMVEVKSVTVKPSLLALLAGDLEVERGDAGRAQDRSRDQRRGQAELGVHAVGGRGQAGGGQARLGQAAVARPPHHRERHADLQRFQGGPLGGGREGQFLGIGRLARRALFAGGRRHRQRLAAQARPCRRAPGARPDTTPMSPSRRAAAGSPSRGR